MQASWELGKRHVCATADGSYTATHLLSKQKVPGLSPGGGGGGGWCR